MIVVAYLLILVSMALVQFTNWRAVRLRKAIDRITVQRIGDRHPLAHHLLQMQWRNVVVIIIRASTVTAPLIQLADLIGDLAAIVLRIEDRDAIHTERDGAP